MSLGTNIQYLRKLNKLTQEQFAEKMTITRQTVSRWEADEVTPELNKLVELCSLFSCKLDALVREDMSSKDAIYSEVEIRKVPAFKMARYVMISPNPEDDVQTYMKNRGKKSGLLATYPDANTSWNTCRRIISKTKYVKILSAASNTSMKRTASFTWTFMCTPPVSPRWMHTPLLTKN